MVSSAINANSAKPLQPEPPIVADDQTFQASRVLSTLADDRSSCEARELDTSFVESRRQHKAVLPSPGSLQKPPINFPTLERPSHTKTVHSVQGSAPHSPSSSSLDESSTNSDLTDDETAPSRKTFAPPNVQSATSTPIDLPGSEALLSPIRLDLQPCNSTAFSPKPSYDRSLTPLLSQEGKQTRRHVIIFPDRLLHLLHCPRNVPRRRLTYGKLEEARIPWSVQRPIALSRFECDVGWVPVDGKHGFYQSGRFKASAIRPWHSDPGKPKTRLWHESAEGRKDIGEAVSTTSATVFSQSSAAANIGS